VRGLWVEAGRHTITLPWQGCDLGIKHVQGDRNRDSGARILLHRAKRLPMQAIQMR
jgi:hypothetical protein